MKDALHRGFTLLEILIALTITATVMSVLFGVYASCLDVARDIEASSRTDQMMRMVVSRITSDIRCYAPMRASDLTAFREEENASLESEGISADNATEATNATRDEGAGVELPLFIGNEVARLPDEEGTIVMSFPSRASLGFEDDVGSQRINLIAYVLVPEDGAGGSEKFRLIRREVPFAGLYPEPGAQEMELADGLIWSKEGAPVYLDEASEMVAAWDGLARKREKRFEVPGLVSWRLSAVTDKGVVSYQVVVRPLVHRSGDS
jgi:prepilin-type N-terminal cleavage/methylation domain-containing protein